MNPPWEILVAVIGWLFFLLMLVGVLILGFAFIYGAIQGVKKWFPKNLKHQYKRNQ